MKKRHQVRFWGVLLFLLITVWQVVGQEGLLASTTQNAQLRVGAGTQWRRVAILPAGTAIALDGRNDDGTWVRGITADGKIGWVATQLVSISPEQALSLPTQLREAPITVTPPPGGVAVSAPPTGGNQPPIVAPLPSGASLSSFGYGGHVSGVNDSTLNYMRQAGMTWVKVQVIYRMGYTADGVAGTINAIRGAGFRVLLGVVGANEEVMRDDYADAYAGYVAGLAGLGADAIEVWNEPNLDHQWPAGQINPQAYVNLLAKSYNAIKSVNPNTIVISAAPAPTGFFGGCSGAGCDDLPFINAMVTLGATNYMDCVGVHYNEGILPPTATSGDPRAPYYTRYYPLMVDTYWRAFGGKKPLCFTELGYLTPEGYPPLPGGFAWASNVTVAQQASWLDSAIQLARTGGKVKMVIVWNVNFTTYGNDPQAGYAIIRPDGSCPACDALSR